MKRWKQVWIPVSYRSTARLQPLRNAQIIIPVCTVFPWSALKDYLMFPSPNMKDIRPTITRIQKSANSPQGPRTSRKSAFFFVMPYYIWVSLMSFAAIKHCAAYQWIFIFVNVKYDSRSAFTFATESGKLHRKSRRGALDLLLLFRKTAAAFPVAKRSSRRLKKETWGQMSRECWWCFPMWGH
jgi:hypothetical protein